jgi:hypothetical protein
VHEIFALRAAAGNINGVSLELWDFSGGANQNWSLAP